jgi:hypothetical protein
VTTILVAATKHSQIDDNLNALEFELPAESLVRLNGTSVPPSCCPYWFFASAMQAMLAGSNPLGDKPPSYAPFYRVQGEDAGIGGRITEK